MLILGVLRIFFWHFNAHFRFFFRDFCFFFRGKKYACTILILFTCLLSPAWQSFWPAWSRTTYYPRQFSGASVPVCLPDTTVGTKFGSPLLINNVIIRERCTKDFAYLLPPMRIYGMNCLKFWRSLHLAHLPLWWRHSSDRLVLIKYHSDCYMLHISLLWVLKSKTHFSKFVFSTIILYTTLTF